MQQGATVNAHSLYSLLELVLAGLVVLVMIIILLFLVAALSGPLLLVIFAAATPLAAMLLAGLLSTILTLLLVSPFIFSFLLFSKQLNPSAVLEVMALGVVDLEVLLVGASWLVGGRQGPVGGAPANLLAGVVRLDLLGGAGVAGSLNGKYGLALTLLCWGSDIFICGVGFHTGVLAGVLPSSSRAHLSART